MQNITGGIDMSVIMSILLGIIQGITEFLPISSSGHLSIFQNLFGLNYTEADHLFFDVLLHIGTLISICVVYRRDLVQMFRGAVKFLKGKQDFSVFGDPLIPPTRMLIFIIIGTLPLIVALPFYKYIRTLYNLTGFIGFALIITGTLLFTADKMITPGKKNDKTMTAKDALAIGFAQMLALIPGLSRSGTTITVGLSRGLNRQFSVRFSLLLSIPAILGSLVVSLIDAISAGINWSLLPIYLIGFVVSGLIGFVAIHVLNALMRKNKFGKFSYYCWIAGAATLILSIIL